MASERSEIPARLSWRSAMWLAIPACLLLPLLAMQITDEVNWTGSDFIAAATALIGAGLALELAARLPIPPRSRAGAMLAIAAVAALLWAQGAVGVF